MVFGDFIFFLCLNEKYHICSGHDLKSYLRLYSLRDMRFDNQKFFFVHQVLGPIIFSVFFHSITKKLTTSYTK